MRMSAQQMSRAREALAEAKEQFAHELSEIDAAALVRDWFPRVEERDIHEFIREEFTP